jgi:tRNA(Ile)-lysidine synthase
VDQPDGAGPGRLIVGEVPVGADEPELLPGLLARCPLPPPGTPVTCAVSGGPDSTALLALAVAAGCRATAVHVDHGLRQGSAEEADVVAATAGRLGASFRAVRASVEHGPNLEARARAARHAALPPDALFGHTADDQAETVLLHLLRGSGLDGLAGIRADARHPLLGLRRSETRALCAALALDVVHDPSNADPAHRRNRIRHEVIPMLDAVADRDVVPLLGRLAGHARDAIDHLGSEAAAVDPTSATALAEAPPVLARLAVRGWLRSCSPEGHPPDAAAVDRVLAVARGERAATEVSGGWRVARTRGVLRVEAPVRMRRANE